MTAKHIALAVLIAALPLADLAQPQPQPSGPYKVVKIQLIGGDGGFDYVTADSDGRNLYVARSGPDGHIGVFNLDTLAQVGDIPDTSAHGAAVDTATGHGFATSKPITMFDAKTFAVIKKIDVEGNPDGYLNDTYNHRFYILSHSEPNITVIDDKDGAILGTIDIGGAPEQAATDGHGKIYVDIVNKAAIAAASVACDADLATSVEGVFAAGEVTGVGGADVAELEGYLAGASAAHYLGRAGTRPRTRRTPGRCGPGWRTPGGSRRSSTRPTRCGRAGSSGPTPAPSCAVARRPTGRRLTRRWRVARGTCARSRR